MGGLSLTFHSNQILTIPTIPLGFRWNPIRSTKNAWGRVKYWSKAQAFNIQILIPFQCWGDLMELEEARSHVVVEYRGGVHHADTCNQGGDLAEEFYERDLRRRKTAHHLMRQSRSHRAGKGQ